ncbi:MAG TPA: molybdenum cofactor guanylyltransferase [Methanomicrobiales archaeon]|jgi:molybdopterin-guanine dinucleotide biosynthesis protein A|nr:molybdenum cofactor guanylyltransferase [Methanomicrobiales archaeon]
MRSAIVLVGGEARRAGGREKYFFLRDGKTFIEHILWTLGGIVDEVVLAARDPAQCERFRHLAGVRCVSDIRKGVGPMGGLHAGVLEVKGDLVAVVACDMPCINARVLGHLFSLMDDYDAVIPAWNPEMLEPLHAVYRRTALLAYLEEPGHRSLREMVKGMRVRYVEIEDLRKMDPELATFMNINKIEELEEMKKRQEGTGD